MIRTLLPSAAVTATDRFALELLVDLARVVPADDTVVDAVRIEVVDVRLGEDSIGTYAERGWLIREDDGVVRIPRDALRRVAEIASAARERRSAARDRFGRVPAAENALVAEGLEREPVVSRAAVALRRAVIAAAGRRPVRLVTPWPDGRRWAAAFTHDLDVVTMWPLFTGYRLVELARKREAGLVLQVLGAAMRAVGADPVRDAIAELQRREQDHAIRSTWFVLCGTPTWRTITAGDLTYRPESRTARSILADISERGGEVALHGSRETEQDGARFAAQRARLERLFGQAAAGVRQHFLRMRPGITHRAMAAAGFQYDSTCGFPDRNGFRLGVADVIPLWDDMAAEAIGIDEAPFCWMDRALSKYRGVEDPEQWVGDALELVRRCQEVEGLWVGVWHPNLSPPLGFPGAPDAFAKLTRAISAGSPYIATLAELVAWRRARRTVRARGIAPDGTVDAYTHGSTPWPVALEDVHGRRAETVRPLS